MPSGSTATRRSATAAAACQSSTRSYPIKRQVELLDAPHRSRPGRGDARRARGGTPGSRDRRAPGSPARPDRLDRHRSRSAAGLSTDSPAPPVSISASEASRSSTSSMSSTGASILETSVTRPTVLDRSSNSSAGIASSGAWPRNPPRWSAQPIHACTGATGSSCISPGAEPGRDGQESRDRRAELPTPTDRRRCRERSGLPRRLTGGGLGAPPTLVATRSPSCAPAGAGRWRRHGPRCLRQACEAAPGPRPRARRRAAARPA